MTTPTQVEKQDAENERLRAARWMSIAGATLTPEEVQLTNKILERCALVADEYIAWPAREIAAIIRAKKIKP